MFSDNRNICDLGGKLFTPCLEIGHKTKKNIIKYLCQYKSQWRNVMARVVDYIVQNVVGDKVKEYRLQQKLSQKDLAERLETYAIYICRGSISRIENHERTVTDYELRAIAKALKVSIYDLYEDDGFIPENKEI